jgi:hypothetical protein
MAHATVIIGQTAPHFGGPAYQYVRASDELPSTDAAYEQEDPLCKVKLFPPGAGFTYFIAGFDPDTGLAFGVVHGFEKELGDFDLTEIVAARVKPFRLPYERDLGWTPKRVSELLR